MAHPQPPARQGLRTNHRLSNRLTVYRIHPALHALYRKGMKLRPIVSNQTLTDVCAASVYLNIEAFLSQPRRARKNSSLL